MAEPAETSVDVPTGVGSLRVRICGSGPPTVLWHSLFVDSTTWDRLRPRLAEHRRLIIIDGPSHGDSEPVLRHFTLEDCALAAIEVLDHLGVTEPVDWVGNAWGGHVGILFAASQPSRARSLVTIGTPVRSLTAAERRKIVPLVWLYRALGPVRPLVKGVEDALLGAKAPRGDAQVISQALTRSNRRGMHAAMRSVMLGRPDLTSNLASVAVPTLMIAVERDALWLPSEAGLVAREVGHSFAIVAGAGHVAPLLQSAPELLQVLADFWRDGDRGGARAQRLGRH